MNRISARTAVVGVARSETPFTPGKTSLQLHAELAREAIAAPSLTAFGDAPASAFAMAGLGPGDIDVAMLCDNFTISVVVQLEDLGLCAKGEGGAFVEEAGIGLGERLPVNPHGGLLSESHPGRPGGISHLVEAVVQLRGDAGERQVDGARAALVHGVGGIMSNHATAILGRE